MSQPRRNKQQQKARLGTDALRLLAEKLGLAKDRYQVTFQSRFGKANWLDVGGDYT